ncbi:DEAD/DEAH box helicase family protein [Tenuibacillus multivorans]|uniref:Superfamily II DNA or RNA helicase n=1 Tax=Tenuibacillus multivorans TaxID=237069 RepID=A0A1G9XR34_9BACI|nr:DEAD/DEAH box helicase family protein [Tenuibacillus multivorans]GEL75784.1 hypothetical protein TMU01_00190 [Tenuibacillus multivorans]SDM99299.1 Superfamily II DNA or RNA helicase [Tenuibacillus multivorans]
MKRVSDEITNEEIEKWKPGDIITIKAGVGAGKSHFIKTRLFLHAKDNNKKILMLVHRINCLDQFQYEIQRDKRDQVIDLKTYQSIESEAKTHREFDFSSYDYIVCDEFHYFMSDAGFNKYTDLSLKQILSQNSKIRILMSATGDYMKRYLEEIKGLNPISYPLPINFDFIHKLNFFYHNETLEQLANQFIENGQKAIFFIESAKRAYELHSKFEQHSLFNCSKSNKNGYAKFVDKEKVSQLLKKEKFEELLLITTTTLDAGVNIHDSELNNIVVDVKDTGTLIQCIGRKRLNEKDKNDHVELYIKAVNNRSLGQREKYLKDSLEKAQYVRKHGTQAYVEKYLKNTEDKSHIVYDNPVVKDNKVVKEINEMIYFKTKVDISEIKEMRKKDYGYCRYIAKLFGFYIPEINYYDYKVVEEEKEKVTLEDYLDSLIGKKLLKNDRNELIDKIGLKDARGRKQKGINLLNVYLMNNHIPYIIQKPPRKSYRDSNGMVKKEETYWTVGKIKYKL